MSSPPHLGSSCLFPARSGLPGSSADLSSHAASNHPGRSDECSHPLLPRRCQASPLSGGLATFHCISGPNRVRLRCGLRVRPSKASPVGLLPLALAGLHVERVIYKVNSFQFTRSARLVLALQRNANCAYLCATCSLQSSLPTGSRGARRNRFWPRNSAKSSRSTAGTPDFCFQSSKQRIPPVSRVARTAVFAVRGSSFPKVADHRVGGPRYLLGAATAVTAWACPRRQRNVDHKEKGAGALYQTVRGAVSTP